MQSGLTLALKARAAEKQQQQKEEEKTTKTNEDSKTPSPKVPSSATSQDISSALDMPSPPGPLKRTSSNPMPIPRNSKTKLPFFDPGSPPRRIPPPSEISKEVGNSLILSSPRNVANVMDNKGLHSSTPSRTPSPSTSGNPSPEEMNFIDFSFSGYLKPRRG